MAHGPGYLVTATTHRIRSEPETKERQSAQDQEPEHSTRGVANRRKTGCRTRTPANAPPERAGDVPEHTP